MHAPTPAGWVCFLQLLRKFRSRQPINGVIVADKRIGPAHRETSKSANVTSLAIRERLDEIGRTLRIDVPVYFLITKCDLVGGFTSSSTILARRRARRCGARRFRSRPTESGSAPEIVREGVRAPDLERLQQRLLGRMDASAIRVGASASSRSRSRWPHSGPLLERPAEAASSRRRTSKADPAARRVFHQRHSGGHAG